MEMLHGTLTLNLKHFLKQSDIIILGTTPGGTNVLSWTETQFENLRVTGLDPTKRHYVSVTAVNKAGLYQAKTFPFSIPRKYKNSIITL